MSHEQLRTLWDAMIAGHHAALRGESDPNSDARASTTAFIDAYDAEDHAARRAWLVRHLEHGRFRTCREAQEQIPPLAALSDAVFTDLRRLSGERHPLAMEAVSFLGGRFGEALLGDRASTFDGGALYARATELADGVPRMQGDDAAARRRIGMQTFHQAFAAILNGSGEDACLRVECDWVHSILDEILTPDGRPEHDQTRALALVHAPLMHRLVAGGRTGSYIEFLKNERPEVESALAGRASREQLASSYVFEEPRLNQIYGLSDADLIHVPPESPAEIRGGLDDETRLELDAIAEAFTEAIFNACEAFERAHPDEPPYAVVLDARRNANPAPIIMTDAGLRREVERTVAIEASLGRMICPAELERLKRWFPRHSPYAANAVHGFDHAWGLLRHYVGDVYFEGRWHFAGHHDPDAPRQRWHCRAPLLEAMRAVRDLGAFQAADPLFTMDETIHLERWVLNAREIGGADAAARLERAAPSTLDRWRWEQDPRMSIRY